MEDRLIETLEALGYEVYRQGSFTSTEDYPESFFTFWNNTSYDGSHYDNRETSIVWDFDVNFYSTDVEKTHSVLNDAIKALKDRHFIISGRGYDMPSGTITHTGRGVQALFLEELGG